MKRRWIGLFVSIFLISFPVYAAVPQTMNYQGYLTDASGVPVNGTVSMTFKLYDVASGGAELWTETQSTVSVSSGVYSVVLGSVNLITLSFDAQYYLGITVGSDAEMTPRQALTSVGYAMRSNIADAVKDNSISASNIGENCQVGQVLAKTASGWECRSLFVFSSNIVGTCAGSSCDLTCPSGYGNCDGNPNNGCETNLNTSSSNCGSCGNQCPADQNCSSGQCVCSVGGYTSCSGTCRNLQTDISNCGSCGHACPADNLCTAGVCVACAQGTNYCNGQCKNFTRDTNNCGSCGNVCPSGQTCINSSCTANNTFTAGTHPGGMASDGTNIWIANRDSNSVTKLNAADGSLVATYNINDPVGVMYDSTNIWVTSCSDNAIVKLDKNNGSVLGTYSTGTCPVAAAFDGTNIWVSNNDSYSGSITKLRASDGSLVNTFSANYPWGILFDGTNIWFAESQGGYSAGMYHSAGGFITNHNPGYVSRGIAYDGSNIWTANRNTNWVTKLRASDGLTLTMYSVNSTGYTVLDVASDGTYIWVTTANGTVTKMDKNNGSIVGTYPVGSGPSYIIFDGINIWVSNWGSGTVTRY